METAPRILVIDDDHNVHETLRPWLSREGYVVESAFGGKDGLDAAKRVEPSLIILDVMMPGLDGVSVCLELNRALPTVPVLMLSARDDVMDRVIGLESGADDYVTKPFHPREIVTRVKALLRRIRKLTESNEAKATIEIGPVRVDPKAYKAFVNDTEASLTTTEFSLLLTLIENPNKAHSRQDLLDKVWGADFYGSERTVDSHIRNLRRKLDEVSPGCDPVESIRGVGYRYKG